MSKFNRRPLRIPIIVSVLASLVFVFVVAVFPRMERPPVGAISLGAPGATYIYNPRTMARLIDANQIPVSVPYAGDSSGRAGAYYENLKVLGDVDAGEFTRLMVNMTTWVSPAEGCAGCHNVENFAEDSKYTKVAARRMLEMVRHINTDWSAHVASTGVTCYTCHRGQLVPPNVWFQNPGPAQAGGLAQSPVGKNHRMGLAVNGGSALPFDPYTPFLQQADTIRVQSTTALPTYNRQSIKQAEWTYALMISMSQALGVNCNYCHSTRAFADWSKSPPQRLTAWHGIQMVRDLNKTYLDPLKSVLPQHRLGPALNDAPKVSCATCHNGVYKPLFGASMIKGLQGFPELKGAKPMEISIDQTKAEPSAVALAPLN